MSFQEKNRIRLEKWAQESQKKLESKLAFQRISSTPTTAEGLVLKELNDFTSSIIPEKGEMKKNENECLRCPTICHDMSNIIQETINKDLDKEDKMVEDFNITIFRQDLMRLKDGEWLNDKIINFYFSLIMKRSQCDSTLLKVYAFDSLFYSKLMSSSGSSDLMKWTKKIDLFQYDLLLIPVHQVNHWSLAAVWPKPNEHAIRFYDSYGKMNLGVLENVKDFMEKEKLRRNISISFQWTLDCVSNIPQQFNGSDCGVFTLMFAECLSRGNCFDFSQKDIPFFRQLIIYEILKGKLAPNLGCFGCSCAP